MHEELSSIRMLYKTYTVLGTRDKLTRTREKVIMYEQRCDFCRCNISTTTLYLTRNLLIPDAQNFAQNIFRNFLSVPNILLLLTALETCILISECSIRVFHHISECSILLDKELCTIKEFMMNS